MTVKGWLCTGQGRQESTLLYLSTWGELRPLPSTHFGCDVLESYGVADLLTKRHTKFLAHSLGHRHGCHSPRLSAPDNTIVCVSILMEILKNEQYTMLYYVVILNLSQSLYWLSFIYIHTYICTYSHRHSILHSMECL